MNKLLLILMTLVFYASVGTPNDYPPPNPRGMNGPGEQK